MDGMLFVTFFFPALVSFNITISIVTFLLTIIVVFGPEVSVVVLELIRSNAITNSYTDVVSKWLGVMQTQVSDADKRVSIFWPVLVSGVTIWTTASTYGVGGAARHGKKGWKFVQPGVGGIRFILVQIFTWITFALSVGMPWTTLENIGWLSVLGLVPSNREDPGSHQGLLVVGSALGMISNTFVILGLMSYDPKERVEPVNIQKQRRKFDTGKWKWNIFGDSEAWWWLFLVLQGTFVVFSWQLAVMLERTSVVKNSVVESLLLMVVTTLLAVPLALTNAIAGKWRHGERNYRLTMPFQGGAIFVALQGLGWTLFSGAFVVTLFKLYSTATASGTKVSISSTASMGIIAYLCIVASLFFFDPTQVRRSPDEISDSEELEADISDEDASVSTGATKSKHAHSILGKRQSPAVKGALEYLVQWKPMGSPAWVLEEILMKEDPDALKNHEKTVRTPRIGLEQRHRQVNSKGRSISPKLKPRRNEVVDDDTSGDESENAELETDSDSEDVWEEVEDEEGNVFYYNEKRKLAQTTLPQRFAEAWARQQHVQ